MSPGALHCRGKSCFKREMRADEAPLVTMNNIKEMGRERGFANYERENEETKIDGPLCLQKTSGAQKSE